MSDFLAEARVLIRPDTTGFRAELQTQINAATKGVTASIPVVATATGAGTAAAAQASAAANAAQLSAGAQKTLVTATAATTKATAELAQIQALATKSTNDLTTAQLRTVTAATEQGAAQITAAAAVRSAAIAQEQLVLALRTGNVQLIEAAALTSLLASAYEAEALAALSAARAENAHAAALANVQKAGIASTAGLLGLRGAVLTAGAGFIGATVAFQAAIQSIQSAAQLEETLNVFQATAGATADEMERVSEAATQLGRDLTLPGVTAQDAAIAMTTLSKAGLDVQESIDGARGSLQLAVAAETDFASAADIVANALNSFDLSGRRADDVANLLAASSSEAQGSIADMALALKQSAAVADLAGISIEDTVTILTQLAKSGLSSSDAGTSFRTSLVRLIKPTKEVQEALNRLNVDLLDLEGNIRPEIFGEIGTELEKLPPALRRFTVAQLGGSDAVRAFGRAAAQGEEGFQRMSEAITGTTAAQDLAAARTQGFTGDLENLSNQAESLGTTLGQIVIPPLSLLVGALADTARAANDTVTSIRDLTSAAVGLAKPFADAVPFLDQADNKLGDIVKTAAKFQILGPGITVASLALDHFGDSADKAAGDVAEFTESLASFDREMRRTKESLEGLGDVGPARDPGLNVQQVLNRVTGFDSAETRARIRGDTEEILSVLQEEQAFLEAQLQRAFVQRRPALQRQLENALFGVVNDIASFAASGATAAKQAAQDAAREVQEADQALLDLFTQRRDDAGRRAAAAAQTEGVQDDIRAQDRIQALIKIQIAKIRDRIKDESTRKAAIRALRIALIASRQEEEQLREEQRQQALTTRQTSIELDIAFAETIGNVNREVAARQRLIALLKKQQAAVKKGTNEWKRLRNEIAEQQQAIKDARDQADETGDSGRGAAEFFFSQLQAQQGFAANLLGNLITGPTAGLVGVPSPTADRANIPDLGARTGAEVGAATGRAQIGPTAGQTNAEIDILRAILNQLKVLNGSHDAPEAINQRKSMSASGDGVTYGF